MLKLNELKSAVELSMQCYQIHDVFASMIRELYAMDMPESLQAIIGEIISRHIGQMEIVIHGKS